MQAIEKAKLMSAELLIKKVEEMSLMIVLMSGPEDKDTKSLLSQSCAELNEMCKSNPEYQRIGVACEYLASKWDGFSFDEFVKVFNNFVSSCQTFLNKSGEVIFPNEGKETTASESQTQNSELPDLVGVDRDFLGQFIEKHVSGLEEFENRLVEAHNELASASGEQYDQACKQLESYVKGYLHNLKGEAAIVGLHAIEKGTHATEDLLNDFPIKSLIEPMREFREWCGSCLKNHSIGKDVSVDAATFISKLKASITQVKEEAPAPVVAKTPEKPVAVKQTSAGAHALPEIAATYALAGDLEVLSEFASEADEHLNVTEDILLNSADNLDNDKINAIFRCVHSIKGASAYFGLEEIAKTSHITENLIDEARSNQRVFDAGLTELMLAYIDLQKKLINNAKKAAAQGGSLTRMDQTLTYLNHLANYVNEGNAPAPTAATQNTPVEAQEAESPAPSQSKEKSAEVSSASKPDAAGDKKLDIKSFVKVETNRLDQLIDTIGEMCTYNQMLIKMCRQYIPNVAAVNKNIHQVEKISRELQDIGMSMRLDPIRGLFQKMSRLVWDTAKKLGKQINFKMEGEDTELDRTLIEKLADPLMHMVRNAIDHGIEKPEDREASGKSRMGTLQLRAYHAGGSVHIQIIDDGKGLDTTKLLAKAIEKGVAQKDVTYSEQEIFAFIFAPGFSTAAVVTDVSGRGVGMDVVRKNIESMRGRVDIKSAVGKGTTFTIELPLTLAIIDGVEVRVGQESYILPALSIVELMRPEQSMISTTLQDGETFHFRGKYLPLFRLGDLYGTPPKYTNPVDALIVVIESGGEFVAIMVDEVLTTQSIVIKRLGSLFSDTIGITGCAIMADGNVGLILDSRSLVALARSSYERRYNGGVVGAATTIIESDEPIQKTQSAMSLH